MRYAFATLTVAALLLAGGCDKIANRTTMSTEDYNRDCQRHVDCEVVYAGSVCGCGFPAAVNAEELTEFEQERSKKRAQCTGTTECEPEPARAACIGQKCQAVLGDAGLDETDATRSRNDGGPRIGEAQPPTVDAE
jgi:hypothetical protein